MAREYWMLGIVEVVGWIGENIGMDETGKRKTVAELFGVPARGERAKERLLNTAIDLFYRHGFNAVGVDRVYETVGVSKTTFYKCFESKDELMVEAVRQRDAWETEAWDRAVRARARDDAKAQLLGYFEVLDEWFMTPDFGGCMFINVASEFPNPNDPVHRAAAEHKRRTRDVFRDLGREAGVEDAEGFADQYALLMEGALVMRQVHGRDDAAKLGLAAVRRLMEEMMG